MAETAERPAPGGGSKQHERDPRRVDPTIYRIVVSTLSLAMLAVAGGILYLTIHRGIHIKTSHQHYNGLIAIGSACVGALAGLLTPTTLRR